MNLTKKLVVLLAALALAAGLAACGGSDDSTSSTSGTETAEETVTGAFEPLAGAPADYEDLTGEAELTRAGGKTTATISLDGLEPDTEYLAHLHSGGCGETDPGGAHFKFNPQGGDEPPNEIHFAFSSNADGSGEAEARSGKEVPAGEAGSIVLHLGGHDEMAAAGSSSQFAALFVHEGVDHSKGETHGENGGHSHGEEAEEAPDKIACAELEGSAASAEATGPVPTVEVKNGEPVGGIQELEFDAGEQIRFKVTADEAEEIHVHGYDLSEDIPQGGGTVEFDFPAEIEGIFEAELEAQGTQIIELRVNP